MKLLFMLVIFLVTACSPSYAVPTYSSRPADFITQETAAGIPICGMSGTVYTSPSQLQFLPSATQAQITQCEIDAAAFNWTPLPVPNTAGFLVEASTTPGVTVQDMIVCGLVAQIVQANGTHAQLVAIWPTYSAFATHPVQIVALALKYNFPVQ